MCLLEHFKLVTVLPLGRINGKSSKNLKIEKHKSVYFHVYGCFADMYIYVPHECLVPAEARRWPQMLLELELQVVVTTP